MSEPSEIPSPEEIAEGAPPEPAPPPPPERHATIALSAPERAALKSLDDDFRAVIASVLASRGLPPGTRYAVDVPNGRISVELSGPK